MVAEVLAALPSDVRARYHDARLLRRGSRGLLLWARQRATEREVVIKLLEPRPPGAGEPLAEARMHASVANLAGVLDLIEADVTPAGWVYLVTPYVEGGSLADRVAEAPLRDDEWLDTAIDVVETVAHVHAAGMVHGDLKPSNLLVGSQGDVLLTDFGCAELISSESTISDSGGVLTTLAYAPPELLQGLPASTAGDAYSLGLTLVALSTGHSPQVQPGEPPMAFLERLTSGDPLTFDDAPVPPAARPVLAAMCRPEPAARPSVAESLDALRRVRGVDAGAARAVATSTAAPMRARSGGRGTASGSRLPWRWIAATVLIAVAAGVFGYSSARTNADREALVFCRSYGELVSSTGEMLADAEQRFRTAPSFANALETMMNDLPRQYASAYQRFDGRRESYPESIRDDIAAAAPAVAKLEMADYLARIDGSYVYDEQRRAHLDRLPAALRGPAAAYVSVDQLAAKTCGLDESRFPEVKQRLTGEIMTVLTRDGAAFFADPANAATIPFDAAELVPVMAPKFIDQIVSAFPQFFVGMFDDRPEVASMAISQHSEFVVRVVESAAAQGWQPTGEAWVTDLRRSLDEPSLTDRLDAALAAAASG